MRETLIKLLLEAKIQSTDQQIDQWITYVHLLDKWNKAYNLTSVRNPLEMLSKHIVDSLLITPYLVGKRMIDVGTGPGLPGIVLAIFFPDKKFVLLDSLGKRIRFLTETVNQLKLNNVQIIHSRVELYQPDELFDGIISRAFASLNDMINWCYHLSAPSGVFYAMKGTLPTDEIEKIESKDFIVTEKIMLNLPGSNVERHLIKIIKKVI
ncbi:16S rRNA (guanine(527)-N(7))-methyltransferase RsmG [Thorsellia anophelis]|uniref:Ribosomal RNA small subunit methyltransferase G n=1 Tax=Thorsellia anophelis DSM 18579 TaxID=1123402 RepID=A0A1I0DNC5_9GAMM|nr:16S rRNA (guanine(527)-N(7))-methyltransferase RsmG [Thorsellia anophelis]SET34011.1 16S rRNA m(7)G-527 methyltransferase [Thorsellia anophelis DSM 18579]